MATIQQNRRAIACVYGRSPILLHAVTHESRCFVLVLRQGAYRFVRCRDGALTSAFVRSMPCRLSSSV